ncbi:GrpE, mitochondrial [Coemansia guatemalensis]|uniref:GrpE protein homolog, mitochondrial n=1 Tax=Coemansia guatemalensis TaxID=2761395 RepID=A0A9W8I7G1_9FUNG|nr:GrpE, mitochondrial [Coemansia guatemalensis]
MFRTVLSRAYRVHAVAAAPRTALNSSNTPAFARRLYSDQPKAEGESKSEAQDAPKKDDTAKSAGADELEKAKKVIAEKDAKIKEIKDAYLRALADAENIRTRSKSEVESTKAFAIQNFAKDLLDTVDILELAVKHVPKEHLADKVANKSLVDLYEGVSMTKSNLLRTLERHGVDSFDPLDKPYDPNTTHALYQAPMPGKTPGHVFAVEKRGYTIKGRVLRPAQVGVVLDPNGN